MTNRYPRPTLLPNEYLESYAARLAMFCGARVGATQDKLISLHKEVMREHRMNKVDFHRSHTLLPIVWAMQGINSDDELRNYRCSRRLSSDELKACPACRQQDMNELGFFYFRNYHQPKGVTLCVKHQKRLRTFPKKDIGYLLDETYLGKPYAPDTEPSPVINKYAEVIYNLLSGQIKLIDTASADIYRELASTVKEIDQGCMLTIHAILQDSQTEKLLESIDPNVEHRLKSIAGDPGHQHYQANLLYCVFLYCQQQISQARRPTHSVEIRSAA